MNRYVTILYLLGRYSGLHRLVSVKCLFLCFYLVRKENGNLWAFALFNVIAAIVLAITLAVYRTWGWGITQYSSLIYLILAIYGVVVLLQAILGREPKKAAA